ncbi:DUF6461 domain-containing protein [Nonomuraea soli]|uniref:Uncharacterized protein n=1 Tax=Nonomuraea soli TaxID=1032476 RepID=A0A7W0HRC2_9ACTN|nr:DUF6461 domain-containing protein [Nonomuraea soli]MBA2892853.1 hypothetical protein [Nonomuraea soli]
MPGDDLYHLLRSYDPSDVSMQRFHTVWCEGIPVEEAVSLLGADPATGTPDRFCEWGPGSDGDGEQAGGLLAGTFDGWTVLIGDHRCTADDVVTELSRRDRRTLALAWDYHGESLLKYARSGELITVLDVFDPEDRSGADPDALDACLEGLRFDLDEGEPAVEPAEAFTSALVVIGRVVGRPLDREWLDAPHTGYVVPGYEEWV